MAEQENQQPQEPEQEKQEKKAWIRRKPGQPVATCISYPKGDALEQWRPAPDENEFEVTEVIAQAAVQSGYFTRTRPVKPQSEAPKEQEPQAQAKE
jgi:hypothetical protein